MSKHRRTFVCKRRLNLQESTAKTDYLKSLFTQQAFDNMNDTALGGSTAHCHLDTGLPCFIHQPHDAWPRFCIAA